MVYPMLDVNGDGLCTPNDVLLVINAINRQSSVPGSSAEGESPTYPVVAVESARADVPLPDLPTAMMTSISMPVTSSVSGSKPAGTTLVSPALADAIWAGSSPHKQNSLDSEEELEFDPSFEAELDEILDLILT
jgi:hypothetical protein